jgi:primosomal protein N' (replication factor Y)
VVARVVLPLPVSQAFSYAIPGDLVDRLVPGQRVRVPFRGRPRTGILVAVEAAPADGLAPLEGTLEPVPALSPPLLALARVAAEETASAWGEALARALPPGSPAAAPPELPAPSRPVVPAPVVLATGPHRADIVLASIARTRAADQGVLLLAPEIEAARAWAVRVEASLGPAVACVTSADRPRQRWAAWWGCRRGEIRIVVGTRAAAFFPLQALGLTVVLDEEDPAHKAPDGPRWHARDLALARLAQEGGGGLLASAAPSLESWVRGRAGEFAMAARAGPWPEGHLVDLRRAPPETILAPPLREAIRETLGRGQPVGLLLNRLGYALSLGCAECGAVRRCPTCRLALAYHRESRHLACRLCGQRRPAPSLCGRCRGRRLVPLGGGTERLEAEVQAACPTARVVRLDGTVDRRRAAAAREAFHRGTASVLVGTQMALASLARRPVGLAALVLADVALDCPDFRGAERTVQLGWRLAERVAPGGSLWLQSRHPEHPALQALASGEATPFYQAEWAERQEVGYPPARRLASLVAGGREAPALLADLAARGRAAGLTVLGPASLPGARLHLALLGDGALPRLLPGVLAPLRGRRRLAGGRLVVDVDPVELP